MNNRKFDPLDKKSSPEIKKIPLEKDFFGSSPAPFVGRFGYPTINLGLLAPPQREHEGWKLDAPSYWAKNNYSIGEVVDVRSQLINSAIKTNIKDTTKILNIAQEIALTTSSADIEVNLEKVPVAAINTDEFAAPHGLRAQLKSATLAENPRINQKAEKAFYDTDLLAADALQYLYTNGINENALSRLLSVGTLGVGKNRKLVPTRWSITATDDTLGKQLIAQIKDHPSTEYQVFYANYLGNHYLILLFPEVWQYELFETTTVSKAKSYMTDFEPYTGRKAYAESTAGGYYSVRLAILEYLSRIKRQAAVLAIRIITPEYNTPLGVWVTRETARKAMDNKPIFFGSSELLVKYVKAIVRKKFDLDIEELLNQSIMLKNLKQQTKLSSFG